MTEQAPKFYDTQRIENHTIRVPSDIFRHRVLYKQGMSQDVIAVLNQKLLLSIPGKRVTKEYILIIINHLQLKQVYIKIKHM